MAGAVFGDLRVAPFVAGAAFGDLGVSLFVAGAVFGDLGVSLFVAGAVFGEIWVDSRSAKCWNFQYKMRCRGGKSKLCERTGYYYDVVVWCWKKKIIGDLEWWWLEWSTALANLWRDWNVPEKALAIGVVTSSLGSGFADFLDSFWGAVWGGCRARCCLMCVWVRARRFWFVLGGAGT